MSVTDAEGCSIGIVGISIFPRAKEEEKAQEQHVGYVGGLAFCRQRVGVRIVGPIFPMVGDGGRGCPPLCKNVLEPHWELLLQCGIGVQIFVGGVWDPGWIVGRGHSGGRHRRFPRCPR